MTDETRLVKKEAKLTAIPPPSEYPMIQKEDGLVQDNEEEAITKSMMILKKTES